MTHSNLPINPTRVEANEGLRHAEHLRALDPVKGFDARPGSAAGRDAEITVRALHPNDRPSLERLAGRDSAVVPTGPVIGAEIDGVLVAVLSLTGGNVIADPFRSTSSAIELLRLRERQLGSQGRRRLPLLGMRRARRRAGGALPGSPHGGSSRLLQL